MDEIEARINTDALFFASEATVPGLVNLEKNLLPTIHQVVHKINQARSPKLFFIGGGASLAASIGGKYIFDRFTTIPTEALNGWQFLSREPYSIDKETFVFATSYSGQTPEALESIKLAKEKSATTIAISNTKVTPLAQISDFVLDYQSKAVYTIPLAIFYWIAASVMKVRDEKSAASDQIISGLKALPIQYSAFIQSSRPIGRQFAETFMKENGFYVLGSGPLFSLAYKLALSVVIENLWIDACPIESGDFYHGPIEIIVPDTSAPQRMAFMHLVGTDRSRQVSQQAISFCRKHGMRQLICDASDFPQFGELFSPFALFVPTEWFIMYMSAFNAHDVDERRYMGKMGKNWGEY